VSGGHAFPWENGGRRERKKKKKCAKDSSEKKSETLTGSRRRGEAKPNFLNGWGALQRELRKEVFLKETRDASICVLSQENFLQRGSRSRPSAAKIDHESNGFC